MGHYCSEHETVFFKKGNMRGYAHPIGDTGEWCNEPEEGGDEMPEAPPPMPKDKETGKKGETPPETPTKLPEAKIDRQIRVMSYCLSYAKDEIICLISNGHLKAAEASTATQVMANGFLDWYKNKIKEW